MASRVNKKLTEYGEVNKLCTGCRHTCKQPAVVTVASCPRYQPKVKEWQQPELFTTPRKRVRKQAANKS